MRDEPLEKVTSKSNVGMTITDPDGTKHNYTMAEAMRMGFTISEILTGTARPAERNEKTGYSPVKLSGDFDASVSLDEKTGKFTVEAPSMALQNKTFRDSLTKQLKSLSGAYKSNPDIKYSYVDENGENKEKSIQDIISDLNAPILTPGGTYNTNSIKYLASAAAEIESQKMAHKNKSNIDLTDNDIVRMNTIAVGPDIKDSTLQLISNLPEAAWLRNVPSYDKFNQGLGECGCNKGFGWH